MFKNKHILVTGAKGMIGKQLVEILTTRGANVTGTDLPLDLRDRHACKLVCENKDIVFHLAGIKGSPERAQKSPASFSVPMIQFNANMVEAAYNAKVQWFLYTSSVGVYHPAETFKEDDVWKTFPSDNDWYAGWAKRIGEMNTEAYMKEYDWPCCSIVRPANVYGPGDNFGEWSMVIPSLIKKAHENDVIEVWGDGSPIRDFIHCRDVAAGMIHMVENAVTTPVNLGSGSETSIKDIATIISKYTNKPLKFNVSRNCGDSKRLMDMSRSKQCGFTPSISLEDGIIETIEWYRKHVL